MKLIDALGTAFILVGLALGTPLVYAGVLLYKRSAGERR